ncbi:MAG: Glycosyltransferase family protein [uncultured bacterium]|nr:MAG: Glycosyltransferase family protein [uncultured bacterium]HBY73422.1 glycosyl transferase family 2 [Candidatus Kerfeldbacteria bacterium]
MKLSIVVPCYNEAKNIPIVLERFAAVITEPDVELICVNNGSTDDTATVLSQQLQDSRYQFARGVTVPKNIGYGHGIMAGLHAAQGEVLAWTHADLQTDPADVIKAYHQFIALNRQDVIIKGKRLNRSFGQWGFTFGMSVIASVVLGKVLYDINAQPKLFHRSLLAQLPNPPDDFSLDLYLLYLANVLGYSTETIAVRFAQRQHGESKWAFSFKSRYKTVLRTIKYIFALRRRYANFHPSSQSS